MLDVLDTESPFPDEWENVVLPIDKPSGITSFDVVRQLRKKLGVRKIGHGGTLDPMATGLLIALVGRATKRMNEVLSYEKTYEGCIRFGQTTASYDAETPVLTEVDIADLRIEDIRAKAKVFTGTILQDTPVYSAVRMNGERLYRKARRGEKVVTPKRYVTIYDFNLGPLEGSDVQFKLTCASGTYVRSIAHELGRLAGVGAHLIELRRTTIGTISVESAWHLEAIPELRKTETIRTSELRKSE